MDRPLRAGTDAAPSFSEGGRFPTHYAWLAGIVVAGLLVRLFQIGQEALWADETLSLLIKHWPVRDLFLAPVDPSPGLYYFLVKSFVPDGAGVVAVRVLSLVFGTASIATMYVVGRLAFSPKYGLLGAAMLAVSPALVDYSQEGRTYSLLILLVLLSATGLLWWTRGLREGRARLPALLLFAGSIVLAFYTHFTSVFWILPAVVGGREITDRLGDRTAKRSYILAAAAMALWAVPEVLRILARTKFGAFDFLVNVAPGEFLATAGDVLLPSALWNGRTGALSPISAVTLLLVLLFAAVRLWQHRARAREWAIANPATPLTLASLLFLPLFVWVFGYAFTPIFMPRTILLAVPGFILLLLLLASLARSPLIAILYLVACGMSLALHGTVRPKEPWRPVAEQLRAAMQPGDGIVMCQTWRAPSLLHALGGAPRQPLFVVEESMIMMEPRFNGPGWERNYHGSYVRAVVEMGLGKRPRGFPQRSAVTPARFWLVESGCLDEQKRRVRAWLGTGKETRLLALPGTRHHEGIQVSLFEGAAAQRPVTVPPADLMPPAT